MSWHRHTYCDVHETGACECDGRPIWLLCADDGRWLGEVTAFFEEGPFYGTYAGGRTGAMSTLEAAKNAVETGICRGKE